MVGGGDDLLRRGAFTSLGVPAAPHALVTPPRSAHRLPASPGQTAVFHLRSDGRHRGPLRRARADDLPVPVDRRAAVGGGGGREVAVAAGTGRARADRTS